jgi:penicillin-binding protein 1A
MHLSHDNHRQMIDRPPSPIRSFFRLLKFCIALLVIAIVGIGIGVIVFYFSIVRTLPDIETMSDYSPPLRSELFAEDGTKIGEFWSEEANRVLIDFDTIPLSFINAFVASEDARFFEHAGVDYRSVFRALIKNVKAGKIVQGGSTITQQVARSLLLTRDRSYRRKIKEAILATQIEQRFSKEEILYLYLNQIYLGNRAYGIESASQNYFRKNPAELDLAEVSLLAGLPSAPHDFSPVRNPDLAKRQQQRVLDRMLEAHFITEQEAKEAIEKTLKIYRSPTSKEYNMRHAPYFSEFVRKKLIDHYGEDTVNRGGLKIYTTLDMKAQQAAQSALKKGLQTVSKQRGFSGAIEKLAESEWDSFSKTIGDEIKHEERDYFYFPEKDEDEIVPLSIHKIYQGIITRVHPDTSLDVRVGPIEGKITKADRKWAWQALKKGWVIWVQLKEKMGATTNQPVLFSLEQEPKLEAALYSIDPQLGNIKAMVGGYSFERNEFNRATQAFRQPGSSFKPIIYAAALDKGYIPETKIADAPVTYQVGETDFWSPQNYSRKFNGPMDFASSLALSVNVIAVKIFHDIGIDYTLAYAHKLGLRSKVYPLLASALGASDVNLDNMVEVYATFADLGKRKTSRFITKIIDKYGRPLSVNIGHESPLPDENDMDDKSGLNEQLVVREGAFIKEKNLQLSPEEFQILYADRIPEDHVITPQTAFIVSQLLKKVIDSGTGTQARLPGWQAGGKTGTTNKSTDTWFIGFTANLATGVWVGFDSKKRIGRGMTGGGVAAPIWQSYMKKALEGIDPTPLPVPENIDSKNFVNLTGGSALFHDKRDELIDEGVTVPEGVTPSEASDFLFEDFEEEI